MKCLKCSDILQDPVILPCLHTFCRHCVTNQIECPDKNCKEKIPKETNSLPESPVFHNIIESYNHILNVVQNSDGDLKCNDCMDDPPKNAVFFCLECKELMCRSDFDAHNRGMRVKKHSQIRVPDGENLEDLVIKPIFPVFMCQVHEKEALYVCKKDEQFICSDCRKGDHEGHQIRDLDYFAGDVKDDLAKDISKMTRGKENEMKFKNYCEQKLTAMSNDEETLLKRIEVEYNSKIKALENHRDNLLEQVKKLSKQNQDFMRDLMVRQEGLIDKLNNFKKLTQPYLYDYPVTYLLEVATPIRDRIKQLERELHPDESIEPKEIRFVIGKLGEITCNPEEYGSIGISGRGSLSFSRPPRVLSDQSQENSMKPRSLAVNEKGQIFILSTPIGTTNRYCFDSFFSYNLGNKPLRKRTNKDTNTACVRFSGECNMAISRKGKIAISDVSESSIYIFSIDFTFITVIQGEYGSSDMTESITITFSQNEELIMASGHNSLVTIFNADIQTRKLDSSFYIEQTGNELNPNLPSRANPIVNMAVNSSNHIFLLLQYDPWFVICDFKGKEITETEYQPLTELIEEVYKPKSKIRKIYSRYDTPLLREKALIYIDTSDNIYIYYKGTFGIYNSSHKESTTYPATDIEEPLSMACDDLSNVYFCTNSLNAVVYGST